MFHLRLDVIVTVLPCSLSVRRKCLEYTRTAPITFGFVTRASHARKYCSEHGDWSGLMRCAGNVNTVAEFQTNVLPFKSS